MGNSSTSFRLRAGLLGIAAYVGVMAAMSCEPLEPLDENVCGNRVLEPGEDCDGNPKAALEPRAVDAGDAGDASDASDGGEVVELIPTNLCSATCRYTCNLSERPDVVCPAHYGCGLDGTCRKPGGLSVPPLSIGGGGVRRLLSGDFDGDGRQDAVALGDSSLDILFFETNGLIDRSLTVPNDRRLPGIGDIDGDGKSDLVLNLGDALGVLTGQDNRTLQPKSYRSGDLDGATQRVVPLGRLTGGNTMLVFVTTAAGNTSLETVVVAGNNTPTRKKVGIPGQPALEFPGALASAVAVSRNTKPGALCPLVAFALPSAPARVYLLTCGGTGTLAEDPTYTTIQLDAGQSIWGGVYFADANADGHDDLLVGANDALYLYRNDGNGVFSKIDTPAGQHEEPIYLQDACASRVLKSPPLAVGDLDGNGWLDLVDERGVLYNPYQEQVHPPNTPPVWTRQCTDASGTPWSHAVIGDFNGNGALDVLAGRAGQPILDVWSRVAGGELNTFTIPLEEPVAGITRGDFDGDTVDDAVLWVAPAPPSGGGGGPPPLDELFVLFGKPLATPEAPLSLGVFSSLEQIVAGRVKGTNAIGAPDLLDDLVLLSSDDGGGQGMGGMGGMDGPPSRYLTIVEGNAGRRLLAPLAIKDVPMPGPPSMQSIVPTQIVVSRFGVDACVRPRLPDDATTNVTPSTIGAVTESGALWLAGCRGDGSSVQANVGFNAQDGRMLVAPVNYDPAYDKIHDALAFFVSTSNDGDQGLWVNDYKDGNFDVLEVDEVKVPDAGVPDAGVPDAGVPEVKGALVLPEADPFDVPWIVTDVDGNGRRDVVVLVERPLEPGSLATLRYGLAIFWNDGKEEATLEVDPTKMSFVFLPDPYLGPDATTSNEQTTEGPLGIIDIALPNINDTAAKELAVLTRDHLYVFAFEPTSRTFVIPPVTPESMPVDFARLPGGQALLAIDANSDGVEDLVVADGQRVVLYLGKEAAR